jgi:hypothetical protein
MMTIPIILRVMFILILKAREDKARHPSYVDHVEETEYHHPEQASYPTKQEALLSSNKRAIKHKAWAVKPCRGDRA